MTRFTSREEQEKEQDKRHRRREQNRLAQRKYRKKKQELQAAASSGDSIATTSPKPDNFTNRIAKTKNASSTTQRLNDGLFTPVYNVFFI